MSVQIKTFVVIDGSLLEFRLLFLLLNCEFTFLFTLPGKTSYMSYAKTWCQDWKVDASLLKLLRFSVAI